MSHSLSTPLPDQPEALGSYDIAIVGAGPVGSLCALAHARKGARVALLEANPKAADRLAGEWLHPPAVRMLRSVGIDLDGRPGFSPGKGFVVFPEDGSEPVVLPYADGAAGLVFEHAALVAALHEAIREASAIDVFRRARARAIEDDAIRFSQGGEERLLRAGRIVGADGRASIVRQSLGLPTERMTCSRMVGVVVENAELVHEGYGYVVLGAPGPMLTVPLGGGRVRVIADMPLDHWTPKDRIHVLAESYAGLLPNGLGPAFLAELQAGNFQAAANELRPRLTYGNSRRTLIGDAAGHYHPMTAAGMTLGFGDALALAESNNFRDFSHRRLKDTRMPQLLAMGLYEVFSDHAPESAALRQAIYGNWRLSRLIRRQTMRLLACESRSVGMLSLAFTATVLAGVGNSLFRPGHRIAWRQAFREFRAITRRICALLGAVGEMRRARSLNGANEKIVLEKMSGAFLTSMRGYTHSARPDPPPAPANGAAALENASKRLLALQREDGAWEGEMRWCPMLAAQYALLHHIMGKPVARERRRLLLRQFEQTRLGDGLWGLHDHSGAYLYVTTLVYVAARVLDVEPGDPLIAPAREFIHREGVLSIPSWGKFWLALLGLYDWRGMHVPLPELWRLPRWLPLHPANWYCHTRLIYMAMAAVYAHRDALPENRLAETLRQELYPEGYRSVDFSTGCNQLRDAELFARPSLWLRVGYALARTYEGHHGKGLRARCRDELIERIRWELQSSSHTSISPVSGMLNILALWLRDPDDADCARAMAKLEDWIWEDETGGTRITGARSATWDTGFALQALAAADRSDAVGASLQRGADFLRSQQIPRSFPGFREAFRNDPEGGWCFAGVWHGWPVSDCAAEAMLGMLAAGGQTEDREALARGIRFLLRSQCRDGGFGSYESRRSRIGLEWLMPAEMFGECMTEHSYVECTASCLAALAACRRDGALTAEPDLDKVMVRADDWLRRNQAGDGSWRGVWGVQYIYGTMFGVKGLVAGGARPGDPALRQACRWLLDRQRSDGGWGEHASGCLSGAYVEHQESQIIQTAWALLALLEAGDSHWTAISRGARFLIDAQQADGSWPKQDMAGVFFRTALLDYALYRQYFPLHALGLFERRRRARQLRVESSAGQPPGGEAEQAAQAGIV